MSTIACIYRSVEIIYKNGNPIHTFGTGMPQTPSGVEEISGVQSATKTGDELEAPCILVENYEKRHFIIKSP